MLFNPLVFDKEGAPPDEEDLGGDFDMDGAISTPLMLLRLSFIFLVF